MRSRNSVWIVQNRFCITINCVQFAFGYRSWCFADTLIRKVICCGSAFVLLSYIDLTHNLPSLEPLKAGS